MNNEEIFLNALEAVFDTCYSSSCKDEREKSSVFMKLIDKFMSECKIAGDSLGTKEEKAHFYNQIDTVFLYVFKVVSEHWTDEEKKRAISELFLLE